ncbi:unnamed protein product [Caenorhabditis angaria]|uniref:Ankyrin repeat and sterile alpha motif domain-containing protein 1B n=1 Tax=Caenorhabditis angaria TaxID=860376 RepID=A0A9P1J4I9_9PELO|nr:unnamed protein product [Caenorhabditis angaria]
MTSKEHVLPKAEVIDACKKGDYGKVAYFLSGRRSKKSRTPLKFFRSSSDSHWLVEYRDEKSQLSLLHHSALEGQNEISKLLIDFEPLLILAKSTKNILPIHLASWNGHLEIVKMMLFVRLDKPVDLVNQVNIFNETPLHLAIQRGHMNVIAYLLRKNADPFIRNENKENVLDVAARIGHPTAIRLLCQTWPDFPVTSAYESLKVETAEHRRPFPAIYPFHLAAKHNHVDCMKILREFGFSLDYTTEDGTALHVAAACGQVDAVRYLLREGINTNIKNQHGQTVLEMIIDLQENRRPEIAQFVKNPEGWKECRAIIEGLDNNKNDSGRETEGSDSEPIWQQLPPQASVQYYPDQRKNNRSIYRPPSVSAKLRESSPEPSDVSVKSDFDYASGTLIRTWNSKMYDEQTGAPRFPKTNPYSNNNRHHSFNRASDTLPVRFNQNRTKPSPPRPSILPTSSPYKGKLPKEPPLYDDWEKSRGFKTIHPGAYDNVPREILNQEFGKLSMKRQSGYSTLPTAHHLKGAPVRPTLREDTFQVETTPTNDNIYKNHFTMSRTTCDREDSLGLTQSPRLDTRASSVTSSLTYACSTLEKTEPKYPSTSRAPLAMPEEITGSVSGTLFMNSPERETNNITAIYLGGETQQDGEKTPDSPPSPNTSKAVIFGALCGIKPDQNASFFATHIGLGSTASSTLSDVSTGSPDSPPQQSPTQESSEGVRIRRYNGTTNIFNASESSASSSSSNDEKKLREEAEWNKVTELFETFGAAPCRESVFVRDYEPRVAVYLRDRGSKALTLQMIDNVVGEQRSIQIPSRLMTVAEWLETDVGLSNREARHIGGLFEKYGYDRYTQLKGCLNYSVMAGMSISGTNQLLIMNMVEQMVDKRPSANGFFYVSDWLSSLELTDYLGNFINSGYKNMTAIVNTDLDENVLNNIGVYLSGHVARIKYSLHRAHQEIQFRETSPTVAPPRPPRVLPPKPCVECSKIDYERIKKLMLTDGSTFCAHQLGIHELSSVHGTKEAHLTMQGIKENLKEWDSIPKVLLEMNCNGIRVYDAKKKILLATHKVYNINVVCQDRKDLNFFSFIARDDQNHFYCYTYCVLTSDITFEIIHTIGMMFDIRRRLDKNISLDTPFNCSHEKR